MLIDTHSHLDFPDFDADRPEIIQRALDAGVTRLISIGTTLESSRAALALADAYPQVYATVGIHPSEAKKESNSAIEELAQLARNPKVVAIGECGLDYHRLPSQSSTPFASSASVTGTIHLGGEELLLADADEKNCQAIFFQQQLDLAAQLRLNVVIHQRDSWEDTITTLKPYTGRLQAVFHCFSGSLSQAQQLIDMGHSVSFTGIVTFKNAKELHSCVQKIPAGSFFLETDCPYLSPEPHRGKRCEPAYTRWVAEKVAFLRGQSLKEIARETSLAAEKFFRLPPL
ncbi:MAG: TatD family deoxyribonuclease [Verrucomicrobia bacterium]|nr:TatD family deoxyribonuclease [Verrucomicrobiota bacterium]